MIDDLNVVGVSDSEQIDGYEHYYAGKLWNLLPAAYRVADSETLDAAGPLGELLARIGASMAVVRSIDRLWEDQSMRTCDSYRSSSLAPELLAANLVPSMDARGQRLDVANTIYYRRHKGTVRCSTAPTTSPATTG